MLSVSLMSFFAYYRSKVWYDFEHSDLDIS